MTNAAQDTEGSGAHPHAPKALIAHAGATPVDLRESHEQTA